MESKNREVRQLPLRLPPHEWDLLDRYSKAVGRTKNEIIRDFVRTLKVN